MTDLFISLRACYNDSIGNGKLNILKELKQQDLEGRECLH